MAGMQKWAWCLDEKGGCGMRCNWEWDSYGGDAKVGNGHGV
jgi:hypothetical protein